MLTLPRPIGIQDIYLTSNKFISKRIRLWSRQANEMAKLRISKIKEIVEDIKNIAERVIFARA